MKDEEEKMHEFMKDFTNAHDNLPKVKGVEETFRAVKISVKTFLIIGIIVAIIMIIPTAFLIYDKTMSIVFTMDKDGFIAKIEKDYKQSLEIVEDNSTKKGNGAILFKTQREPIVEFKAVKTIRNGVERYYLEYEGNALNYYIKNGTEEIFKGIEIEKIPNETSINIFKTEEFYEYKAYLSKEGYDQIEEGVHQLVKLKKFMEEKIKKFEIPLYLKIGDYTSWYDYKQKKTEEEIINQEKQLYYWYLKNKGEDVSFIPEEDLLEIDRPQTIKVYVNGERLIDIHGTTINDEVSYAVAVYNQDKKYYETDISAIIAKCDKFQMLSDNPNMAFDFIYQGKKYEIRWIDNDKAHGKKLPARGDINQLEEVLKIKLEYDYPNKKVNLIIP